MIALVCAALLVQTPATRAESLLAAGRAHFAGRVVGRYPALEAFRAAARLIPTDPEPLYWQMKVGFYLGSDEGDVIAREAILRILAIDPEYEDVWDRVWMIASPDEVAAHDAMAPGERRSFFARFWAKRDPNLITADNERIAEHFRRFAYARRYFRLLHPMNLYHRSPRYRVVVLSYQNDYVQQIARLDADSEATASSLAGLVARGWSAFFQSADQGLTDAYYRARGDSAAAMLWSAG